VPIHIHPNAQLADRVLLPGDPGRALRLAQALLQSPKMFNHNRGLWGYTGTAPDEQPLTVQSTGMGGPSTAIVVSELVELGATRLLRVGTCGALRQDLELGQLVIATEALCDDGTSRALGAGDRLAASPGLIAALQRADSGGTATQGPVVSTDLFYGAEEREAGWRAAGAVAVEMEAATLFALAARQGVQAGCALIVSDLLFEDRARIEPDDLLEAEVRLGQLALRALGALGCASTSARA
jgi:DeoD family purine-nucleoside phosphorylase